MGEATEDLRRIRQAGRKLLGCTSSTLQSTLKNVLRLPCNVNRWHLFLLCFLYISIQISPDGAFQLCVGFISSECSYKPTLAQSPGNGRSHLSQLETAAYRRTAAVSRCFWVSEPLIISSKSHAEEGIWLFSCGAEWIHITTGSIAFFKPRRKKKKKKTFCHPVRGWRKK